ncbi:MAG: hypothetical protein ABIS21_06305 [Acidimicrobiales bacterium]
MSTTTGPRAPGWHPDPDGGDYLRHWNGRKWGGEKRLRPSWAGGAGGGGGDDDASGGDRSRSGPGPARRRSPRWWLVVGAVVVALAAFVLFVASLSRGPRIPPRSVTDISYTRGAEAACKRVLPALRAQRPQPGDKPKDEAELVAEKVERTADGLEQLVVRLRALPVAAGDQGRVGRWLDDWDAYIAVGRRYTNELRQGENEASTRAARDGDPLTRRVYLFSRANGMPTCVL